MRRILLSLLLPLVLVPRCSAQIENCASFKRTIDKIVNAKPSDDVDPDAVLLIDIGSKSRCFLQYLSGKNAFQQFVQALESSRTDKQSGAGAGGAGSTSVVAQGAVAKSLSVATEYGALTQSVSGQVITVKGNLAGIPSALVGNNIFPYCIGDERKNGYCVSSSTLSILRRLSFSASLDASRDAQTLTGTSTASPPSGGSAGSAQSVTFTGKKRELASFSVRLELWNRRDATSQPFRDAWSKKIDQSMEAPSATLLTADEALNKVQDAAWYKDWRSRSLELVRAAGRDRTKLVAALNKALEDFASNAKGTISDDTITAASKAYNNYFLAQDDLIDTLAKSSVVAIEYTDQRPLGQTPVNNVRLIVDKPLTPQEKVTANGAVDFYGSVPSSAGSQLNRFRDVQAGLELDRGILGGKSIEGPATLSFAGYYQYQHSPVLLDVNGANPIPGITFTGLPTNASAVFAKTGNIWLVQAKLSLVPSGKSVKIPISVTYSNKTELVDKPTWRAQIGVSYDFDSLMSLLAAK